ncbi:aldose 1-epimerase [Paenibacillus sp. MWE-103]|uniref:Aldose 1-epimerase n=1 Tax=Paenibacillus artemisiicola TaxID=1172618 RepID=A0ABS3W4K4_9BACL|nr:aldose 1-epimerase [Paenibacillus artemisiicola]MBO7743244.1 aldose 1-epimerase [Paenibacillus artemisiicola]
MHRYAAALRDEDGMSVVVLTDAGTGSEARLLPDAGNNLFAFASGGRDAIRTPVPLRTLRDEAGSRYGTPVLSPPNRIRDGRFAFRGRDYRLPLNEPPDHHLHGELCRRAWEIVGFGADEAEGAWATSRFRYADHPDILAYFPHALTFTVTYRLRDGRLRMESVIRNEGTDEAPFAYGLHPYFAVPEDGAAGAALNVPAREQWPITNLSFATGRPSATAFSRAVAGEGGAPLAEIPPLGCAMLTLDPQADPVCRIALGDAGYSIAYRLDRAFRFVLLFRPDWDDAFSIEPYTYVTDAFNLPYEHELTGAQGLPAGEERRLETDIWIEDRQT